MSDPSLIVPVELDVLVFNEGVKNRDGDAAWWQYNYKALEDFHSPEPPAFGNRSAAPQTGVYLHWSLPQALRHGQQDATGDGAITYPMVPNRWLVVRTQGDVARTSTAWVIESDCPLTPAVTTQMPQVTPGQTSNYLVDPAIIKSWKTSSDALRNTVTLDETSTEPQVANIGISFPLDKGWSERAGDTGFLTAVAPGNPVFSIFYPHNVGVFSMYDDLTGVDTGTLSYMVMGWYSDPTQDILADSGDDADAFSTYLNSLNWELPQTTTTPIKKSVYQGTALSIDWQRSGTPPTDDPLQEIRDTGQLNAAIGNTTIDAFTALTRQQLTAAGHPDETINLMRAFQYNLLPIINQVNGDAILEETIRQAWFGSEPGGYLWTIVEKSSDGSAETVLSESEAAWLNQLNADQQKLDVALAQLFAKQWDFNAAWWKLGRNPDDAFPPISNAPSNAEIAKLIDPTNATGIAAQLLALFQTVNANLLLVPQPVQGGDITSQDAYVQGIANFALAKKLADTKTLKAVAGPRYWKPSNPVVVLSGVEPHSSTDPDLALSVRDASEIVTGVKIDGKTASSATVGTVVPMPTNMTGLPPEAAPLMTEFFLVDPASAPAIATALALDPTVVKPIITAHSASDYLGQLSSLGLGPWLQPWNPMYFEWSIKYTQIPYQTGSNLNWTFDGQDYQYTPNGGAPETVDRDIGGISLLSPHVQFIFKKRLTEYLAKYPDGDLQQLDDWIEQIDQWKILAQELTGMNELLAMRDPRAFRRPVPTDLVGSGTQYSVSDLAGFPSSSTAGGDVLPDALQGKVNQVPYLPNGPDEPFHGVRQGQFYFEALSVYDKFGRQLHVIESGQQSGLFGAKNFPLIRDAELMPDKANLIHSEIAAVAQVPPRVLQDARLDFQLADGTDETKIFGEAADVNPIGGWVLPNHIDQGILLYAPDGTSLGEFRLFAQQDGTKVGKWQAPPHSAIASLDDVGREAPLLKSILDAAQIQEQSNFESFLQSIDETLWTIDPLGNRSDQNLSVLIGRPLAVIRARLQLNLHGPAYQDSSWAATLAPPVSEFLDYNFSVRLGDQATRQDGVIGYFLGENYALFNSVVAPSITSPQTYIKQIGPIPSTGPGNFFDIQFKAGSQQYVTLLADPRASMHAVTGILPIKQVDIPAGFIETALQNIEVSFRVGPILTRLQETPTQGGAPVAFPNSVSIPTPTEQNGEWSWWEKSTDTTTPWAGYDLLNTTPTAKLKEAPNSLREGVLQLSIDLAKNS